MASSERTLDQAPADRTTAEQPAVPPIPGQPPTPPASEPRAGIDASGALPRDDREATVAADVELDPPTVADAPVADGQVDIDGVAEHAVVADHRDDVGDADESAATDLPAPDLGDTDYEVAPFEPFEPPTTWAPIESPTDVDLAAARERPVRRTVVDAERHLIAPVVRPVGRRPRVRKVTRVLRHVDPWSMFKIAAVFSLVIYAVVLTAGVLLWNVADSTGTIDNVEQFFESFGWSDFEFEGGEIYHNAWIGGLFLAVALTGFAVLAVTLFNLITDLVGGVRMTVLEEEVVERTESPTRKFTVRRTGAERPDDTGEVGLVGPVEDRQPDR